MRAAFWVVLAAALGACSQTGNGTGSTGNASGNGSPGTASFDSAALPAKDTQSADVAQPDAPPAAEAAAADSAKDSPPVDSGPPDLPSFVKDFAVEDVAEPDDVQEPPDVEIPPPDAAPDAASLDVAKNDANLDTLLDPPDLPPAPDVPEPEPIGCLKPNVAVDGYGKLAIDPAAAKLLATKGAPATLQFTAKAQPDNGGAPVAVSAKWQVEPASAGGIDDKGLFTATGTFGGTAKIYAHYKTLCAETTLTIKLAVIDATAEPVPGVAKAFAAADGNGAGPAWVYPPDGAMVPKDFAPITPQFTATGTVFDVRFECQFGQIDIVGGKGWAKNGGYAVTIAPETWKTLFAVTEADQWTLRVLAATNNGAQLGAISASPPQTLKISHQNSGGAVYYWNTALQSVRVLEQGQTAGKSISTPGGMCPGCHSISPDGSTVAVSFMANFGGGGMGSMSMALFGAKSGQTPPWLHANAQKTLASSFTISAAFSKAYFTATDKRMVVPSSNSPLPLPAAEKLLVVDLLKGTSAALVKGGDLGQQAWPTWSPKGDTVVFASGKDVGQGFSSLTKTALYAVPFNGGAGGNAVAVAGASDPNVWQYYPTFTVDGNWVVFNRAKDSANSCPQNAGGGPQGGGPANGDSGTYDNCHADLWAIAPGGGQAIRLDAANGGPEGLTNSWPTMGNVAGSYYWMAFSSRRNYGLLQTGKPAVPQIWVAAIDPLQLGKGKDGSFPALWLPGQDLGTGCHLARWSDTPRD